LFRPALQHGAATDGQNKSGHDDDRLYDPTKMKIAAGSDIALQRAWTED